MKEIKEFSFELTSSLLRLSREDQDKVENLLLKLSKTSDPRPLLFKTASELHEFQLPNNVITDYIIEALGGKDIAKSEIGAAVEQSAPAVFKGREKRMEWPAMDPDFQKRAAKGFSTYEELPQLSHFDDSELYPLNGVSSQDLLKEFFGCKSTLLCVGNSPDYCDVKPAGDVLKDVDKYSLIVPNRMARSIGRDELGKLSNRCLDNTDESRDFLVIRFPSGTLDEQTAWLLYLSDWAPLALIVHTGTGLEGWFPCRLVHDDHLPEFMHYACRLGADPSTWSRCEMVALPGGKNSKGEKNAIVYLNTRSFVDPWDY
jgi:hypothetical protein